MLTLNSVFTRNPLRRPYFAFTDIEATSEGEIVAHFAAEQEMGDEAGAIAAAEAGRHLAILGSVAASSLLDGTHYLLATEAHLRRLAATGHESRTGAEFIATARVTGQTRRGVMAHAALFHGQQLFDLEVSYQVLPARLFERLFAFHQAQADMTALAAAGSPYRQSIPFHGCTASNGIFTATCGPLPPEACAGHFPNYPAWPVALVMHCLSRLAGSHLHHLHGKRCRYWVDDALVEAEHLAFCTNQLTLRSEHLVTNDLDCSFRCTAHTEDKLVGQMVLKLTPDETRERV